jgi:hypothetical protein
MEAEEVPKQQHEGLYARDMEAKDTAAEGWCAGETEEVNEAVE